MELKRVAFDCPLEVFHCLENIMKEDGRLSIASTVRMLLWRGLRSYYGGNPPFIDEDLSN